MTPGPICVECFHGEITEPATCLVIHPNPDESRLSVRKWVCDEHLAMLAEDYGDELTVLKGGG